MSYLELLKTLKLEHAKKAKEEVISSFDAIAKEAPTAKKAKEAKEAPTPGEICEERLSRWRPSYAHPWPDTLPGLGPRAIQALSPCESCGAGTWCAFGGMALCLPCATSRAQ